jgi:hypothetical protein
VGYTDPDLDDASPKPGDVSMCVYCGAIAIFTEALLLVTPDETEAGSI